MSKIEWIDYRRPSSSDSDDTGYVLTEAGLVHFRDVASRAKWIPVPSQPKSLKQVVDEICVHTSNSETPPTVILTPWYRQLVRLRVELKRLSAKSEE